MFPTTFLLQRSLANLFFNQWCFVLFKMELALLEIFFYCFLIWNLSKIGLQWAMWILQSIGWFVLLTISISSIFKGVVTFFLKTIHKIVYLFLFYILQLYKGYFRCYFLWKLGLCVNFFAYSLVLKLIDSPNVNYLIVNINHYN